VSLGPIFVAGTNGSGTRAFASVLEAAGVYQGLDKNEEFEPLAVLPFTRDSVPRLVAAAASPTYELEALSPEIVVPMKQWLRRHADGLRRERPAPDARWGWKHPRNLFIAPLLAHVFPDCFYLHVVRDGRDLAFAANQGDVLRFHADIVGPGEPGPVEIAAFWARVNCEVSRWCRERLAERYQVVRYESLCTDPEGTVARMSSVLGIELSREALAACASRVRPTQRLGRWQAADGRLRREIEAAAEAGLALFGYDASPERAMSTAAGGSSDRST